MSVKFNPAYWNQRIRRRGSGWATQVSFAGERHWITVQAASQREAAQRICDAYIEVRRGGWEALGRRQQSSADQWTVEDFIRACATVSTVRPVTFEGYAIKLRHITRAVCRKPADRAPLETLTRTKILRWQIERERAGKNPASTNTYLRLARSLWGRAFLEPLGLDLENPFRGIRQRKTSTRYHSAINLGAIVGAALQDDRLSEPATCAILLAGCAGLRRSEIDALEWSAFQWEAGVVQVRDTPTHKLKTPDSAGDVALDASVLAWFRERAGKGFVLPSASGPARRPLRAECWLREATAWLRRNGVDAQKPLHTLRKEVGAVLTTRHGIYAASRFLRHANVAVTAAYYADQKERVSAGVEI